jgi:hypothetical protein
VDRRSEYQAAWSAAGGVVTVLFGGLATLAWQAGNGATAGGRANQVAQPAFTLFVIGALIGFYFMLAPLLHWPPYREPSSTFGSTWIDVASELSDARHIRDVYENRDVDHAAIDAWISRVYERLRTVDPAKAEAFRVDTGAYSVKYPTNDPGDHVRYAREMAEQGLRRLDRHVERLSGLLGAERATR